MRKIVHSSHSWLNQNKYYKKLKHYYHKIQQWLKHRSLKNFKILVSFITLLLITEILILNISFPRVYIANHYIGFKTKSQIKKLLNNEKNSPIEINLKDRIYNLTYEQLGVDVDIDSMINEIFSPNRKILPLNLIYLINNLINPQNFPPKLVFNPEFYLLADKRVISYKESSSENNIQNHDPLIRTINDIPKFKINAKHLKFLLLNHFLTSEILEPALDRYFSEKDHTITQINNQLKNIYKKPLNINISGIKTPLNIQISQDEVKQLLKVNYQTDNFKPQITLEENKLREIINQNLSRFKLPEEHQLSYLNTKNEVLGAFTKRYEGQDLENIDININSGPNTDGRKSAKYIEVDISQQMMYLFNNSNLDRSYKISSGLYYPTPTGEFTILNKATNAFSSIFNVWMPFWMAFSYSRTLNAYFGIHELPYWISENGKKISRPRERIGNPSTGGCIALDIGEAREVYEWSEVGTPIYIYK